MGNQVVRAAVLIGVNRTEGLPVLADAVTCARRMEYWIRKQGVAESSIYTITDETEPVTVAKIQAVIRTIVTANQQPHQLIIYFAGHGMVLNYKELWLLSDAPVDTQAAVDLTNSEWVARYCGIPHVIFISDACRIPAHSLPLHLMMGSGIFPNFSPLLEQEGAIDHFFACRLGHVAAEVKDLKEPNGEFTSVYTEALLLGLEGKEGIPVDCLDGICYVRPRVLKRFLYDKVKDLIAKRNLQTKINQIPDARITSDPEVWISEFISRSHPFIPANVCDSSVSSYQNDANVSERRISLRESDPVSDDLPTSTRFALTLKNAIRRTSRTQHLVPIEHSAPNAMLTILGDKIIDVFGASVIPYLCNNDALPTAELAVDAGVADAVVLTKSGFVAQIPLIKGKRTVLVVQDGRLRRIYLESKLKVNSPNHDAFQLVRDTASEALLEGAFQWSIEDIPELLLHISRDPWDLGFALYAGYMLDGLRHPPAIGFIQTVLRRIWGIAPLDLYFDSDQRTTAISDANLSSAPGHTDFPYLSIGWARLNNFNPYGLRDLMLDGPWSTFSQKALPIFQEMHRRIK